MVSSISLRQQWKTAMMAAASYAGDSRYFLADYLLRFLRVSLLLSLWRIILEGRGPVSGMTMGAVLTYTLIAEVFGEQLTCRGGIEDAFWEGTVVTRFLRPMGMVGQFAAEMVGRWCFTSCTFSLPLLLAAPLLGVDPAPVSPAAGGLFLVSLVLGVSIGLALEFFFAALMVSLELSVWLLGNFRAAVGTLLSGALLPLALLPWGLGELFAWLPFASMASAPLRIYTGSGDPAVLLAVQAAWAVALWPLAGWLWRASRERMVSHGG
jgi:ABC-2 type transport system permease protein